MNKTEFIKLYAKEMDMSGAQAKRCVEKFIDLVEDVLLTEDKLSFVGFGSFEVRFREGRIGRNPRDPEKDVEIPSRHTPAFKPGKTFKTKILESRK